MSAIARDAAPPGGDAASGVSGSRTRAPSAASKKVRAHDERAIDRAKAVEAFSVVVDDVEAGGGVALPLKRTLLVQRRVASLCNRNQRLRIHRRREVIGDTEAPEGSSGKFPAAA